MYDHIVQAEQITIDKAPCNNGRATFPQVPVICEIYGEANDHNGVPKPVIVILPFFLGSAHAAGHTAIDAKTKKRTNVGYWDGLIGPGAAMDTDRYRVISFGPLISSHFGPKLVDPTTRKPYGSTFPDFAFADYAAIQRRALEQLGVRHVDVLVGASMGSMQAWHLAAADLSFVSRLLLVVPSGMSLADRTRIISRQWVQALESDPDWAHGDYYPPAKGKPPVHAMPRVLADFWYRVQFPLDHAVMYDLESVELLEHANLGPHAVIDVKSVDEVLAGLDKKDPRVKAYADTLVKLVKVTDHNELLWQLRAIQTFDPIAVMKQSDAVAFVTLGDREPTDAVPQGSTLHEVLLIATESDDVFESSALDRTLGLMPSLGVRAYKVSLPPALPHAAGLASAGLAGLARQIGAFINRGSPQVAAAEHPAARL